MQTTKNEAAQNKNTVYAIIAVIAVIILGVGLVFFLKPILMPDANDDDSIMEEVKSMYAEQEVDLTDEDITITRTTNEDGTESLSVTVSEDKQEQMKKNAQRNLDKIISDRTGIPMPNRDGDDPDPDAGRGGDPSLFPTIEDVINEVNVDMGYLNEYLQQSLEAEKEVKNPNIPYYLDLLLKQRQTGSPSADSPFATTITPGTETSYAEFQKRLNALSFLYSTNELFRANESMKYYIPYMWGQWSNDLYKNILDNKIYNTTVDQNAAVSIQPADGDPYVLHTIDSESYYTPVFELKTPARSYVFSYEAGVATLLDAA